MGSGASCCCGGKSVDVIATNTDARPWMKDEATGPDDLTDSTESLTDVACGGSLPYSVSVDAIHVSAKKGKKGRANGGCKGGGGGGNGGGTYRCSCGATGNGMVGGSGSGIGGRLQHCGCGKQGGVGGRQTCVHGECGSGRDGGCPVDGEGSGGIGGAGFGGGGGGGVRFGGRVGRGGAKAPRPVRRSATFVKPANSSDMAVKQHPRGPMSERRRTRIRHSKSLTSSQFPNLANLLDDGKTSQKTAGGRPDHRGQQAPKNNKFTGKNTTGDHNKGEYTVSVQRTRKHVSGSGALPGAAGGLSFSRYHAGSDNGRDVTQTQPRLITPPDTSGHTNGLTTPPNNGRRTHRLTTPGRGVRESSAGRHHGARDEVAGGNHLDVRGQSATLYSKDGSHVGAVEVANNMYTADEASSNTTGSTASETGSSGTDAYVENRRNIYKKAEGFFLPIDSLVPPTPKKTMKKNKKKKGTAFVITFNDSGIESASIEGKEDDNTSSDDESEATAPCNNNDDPARTTHKLSDPIESSSGHENWATNQQQVALHESSSSGNLEPTALTQNENLATSDNSSKQFVVGRPTPIRSFYAGPTTSRGRRTPVPVKNVEGDFGPAPYHSVGQSFRPNYLRESGSDPVSRVRGSYQAYQQARQGRSTDIDTSGGTTGSVGGTQPRRRGAPLADVSAYLRRSSQRPSVEKRQLDTTATKRHINDLRFLLSHRLSQQTRQARIAGKTTASNKRSKYSDALVKSFQEEIVRLENDLQRTESKLTQTTSGSNSQSPEPDVAPEEPTDSSTNTALKQRLHELAELDHDFANQLQRAQEQLSDDDIRNLLDAHVRRRQELIEEINAELNGSRQDGTQPGHGTATEDVTSTSVQSGIEDSITASVGSSPGQCGAMVDAGCEAQTAGKRDAATGPEPVTHDMTTTACRLEAPVIRTLLTDTTTQASHTTSASLGTDAATDTATSSMVAAVGNSNDNSDKHSRSVAQMIDGFSQDTRESNDAFVQTTWARRDNLSPDDFNRLLSEHLSDIQNMRRIREAESRKLNEALERRKMKISTRQDEDDISENSEEGSQSDMDSESEEQHLEGPRVDRLPATKEELERLLAEHVERQRQLLAIKATKRQTQNDELQRMLQRRSVNKARDTSELSESESDEFDYSDTRDVTPPTHSTQDGDTTSHEKTAPVTENADDLIRAHRDRRENLQRWRDEDKKLKNEKLQEKLSERLKQKK